jgi:hypothetical protein
MEKKDDRMNATTEALNNIKMLKLYSWIDIFKKRIVSTRNAEISVLKKKLVMQSISIASLYFFPQMLSCVIFTSFIGTGHTLDLSTAFTVLTILNIIKVFI